MSRISLSCVLAVLLPVLATPALAQEPASTEPAAKAPESKRAITGGRDISSQRDLPLVWSEIIQLHDRMVEVENKRSDMRAITLSPQEQALFVAYAKRLYDLSKELEVRSRPQLDKNHRVKVRRALKVTRGALSDIRSIGASPIHRDLPEEMRGLAISLKGVYQSFPYPLKMLGDEGLPTHEDLRWKGHAGQS